MMYISTKSVFITVAMWLLLMVGYGRVDAAEDSAGGAPVNDKSGELDGGILVYNDLAHRDVLCRYIQIPAEARRIRATAAVIGLTGNPNLFSGFDEQKLRDRIYKEAAPTNQGGYHMIHDTYFVPKSSDGRFYLCVTTFATQGTDFVLTGVVSNAAEFGVEPVMPLLMEYPTVQSVEAFGRHREDRVVLPNTPPTEASDGVIPPITITVAQIVGETDLMVHACGSEQSLAVSAVDGPDTVTITNDQLSSAGLGPGSELCVVVKTNKLFASASTFWLVVSQNPQGPFVMQSLPMYAVIPGKGSQRVRRFRTYFNKGTDLTITANPVSANAVKEAASRPGELQSGSLPRIVADTTPTGQTWRDHGDGHIAIDKSSLEAHSGQGEVVYVSVTPPTGWHENSEMPFELTVTTSSTVRDLQDGKPTTVTISDSRKFRDFRYWVPKHARIVLSIVGDSSRDGSGLAIFADTTRYSHDPRGYTFNTMEGSNEIFLTNMKYYAQAHPGKVQYINCDMGYIYLTVKSCAVANGKCVEDASVPSTFTLTVSSDSGSTHVQDGVPIHEKVHMAKKFVYTNPMLDKSGKKKKEEGENNGDVDNTETDSSEASSIHFNDLLVKAAVNGGRGSLMLSNDENFATTHRRKCKTIKGDGSAQLEENASKGNVAGKWMHVRAKCEGKCSYRLTGAFFLKSNSLRLNYRPMTVPLDGGSFKDWMVGYKDTDHWLLHTEVRGQEADAVKTCIKDQCCTAGTCTLYGFGKEIAKLENMKSDAISYVQLWATKLSSPVMDEWLDVSKRGSNIYRLNTNSLVSFDAEKSSTFSTGAKVTVADSLFGDYQVLSGENLIDCSGNKMKFVKVEGASRVRIHAPLNLQVGEWAYNPHWVMWGGSSLKQNVHVESCNLEPADVRVNGTSVDMSSAHNYAANDANSLLLTAGDATVAYRVGLFNQVPIPLSVHSTRQSLEFIAPPNAQNSLYRVICSPKYSSASSCALELSESTLHSAWTGCKGDRRCSIAVPSECLVEGSRLSVEARKGPIYGLFHPATMTGAGVADSAAAADSLGVVEELPTGKRWSWTSLFLLSALVYMVVRCMYNMHVYGASGLEALPHADAIRHALLNLQRLRLSKKFGHSDSSNHMLEMGTEMDYHDIESNHEHTNTGGYRRHDVGQQLTSRPTSTYAPLRYDESL
ncbi:hypothetical protein Pmar_PMAR004876 [Perkinsus marinus ATCC 50983]|uniref:Uncharacterized protein n=1 Tax=Perkinsus marinus (strain ATCC 50983 / TXsc) TaxID=423536 RepID=C5LL94_PERM5|nr:hypothetical protein Pmar_PMAR004876 [Perkinsus marinus ATCC 50983]EER02511.1 hypothetical protein Pmar_PMAR004876 [Perkinsus marinus ATCC 50983]|eukprot:XP_002769793.1 hypothetical protein Pmar_PMAR004876 [Perkinsus marinus ATCC 50983]